METNQITSFGKFRLLLWKNFLLQWNQKIALVLEVLVPVLFGLSILLARTLNVPPKEQERRFAEVKIDNLTPLWLASKNPPRKLAYSPKNDLLGHIMTAASVTLSLEPHVAFASARDLKNGISADNTTAAILFADMLAYQTVYPKKLEFEIRFPSVFRTVSNWQQGEPEKNVWSTNKARTHHPQLLPINADDDDGGTPPGYLREGFAQIQNAITMAYIKLASQDQEVVPEVVMRRTPYPEYFQASILVEELYFALPFLVTIGFTASTINMARYIAQEKESQLKEIMKIMGVPNWIHWLAWFVRSFFVLSLVSILFVFILKVPVVGSNSLLDQTDWTLLLFLFLVWSIALIWFSFMMAVCFNKAITAAFITALVYFVLLIPLYFAYGQYYDLTTFFKLLICFDMNLALELALYHIIYLEGLGEGAHWNNLFKPLNEEDNFALGYIMLMMLLTAFILMLICLYIEQVFPGAIGVPKKCCFPFQADTWRSNKARSSFEPRRSVAIKRDKPEAFEKVPKNARAGVKIRALSKRYGNKWVVRNLSLDLLEDEVTVLLGHNGAGKTALISMLTGMLRPTMGTAIIDGYDIRTEIDKARASMGICPQHNVLFADMSVANHLIFFTRLKGVKGRAVKIEVERFLKIMGLKRQANKLPSHLSGGMKRKLALCCALCGDSKVVFCDEPSSGMDPAARRQLWDLIQSEKIGRTVLLTTHFMDEADVLGDRIAIMSNGELKCHGSSFFLKKNFGSGHSLICVKKENPDIAGLTRLLEKYINGIQPESDIGSELTYRLPDEYSHVYGAMLQDLEKNMEALGFTTFGISGSSLEEVFMKIGAENADPNVLRQLRNSRFSYLEDDDEEYDVYLSGAKPIKLFGQRDKRVKFAENDEDARVRLPSIRGQEHIYLKAGASQESLKGRLPQYKFMKENLQRQSSADEGIRREAKVTFGDDKMMFESLETKQVRGCRRELHQWSAMFYKTRRYTLVNWLKVMFQNAIGVTFVTVAILSAHGHSLKTLPPLTIGLQTYPNAIVLLEVEADAFESEVTNQYKKYIEQFGGAYKVDSITQNQFENYFLDVGKRSIVDINKNYMGGATISKNRITAWFNNNIYHAAPLSLLLIHNAIAKAFIDPTAEIKVTNNPLPFTEDFAENRIFNNNVGKFLAFFLSFSLGIAAAFYADFIIREKISGYKHLQLVSGLRISTFWLTHFIWDFLMMIVVALRVMLSLLLVQEPGYSTATELACFFLLLTVFGFAAIPWTYFIASFCNDPVLGFVRSSIFFIFTGVPLAIYYGPLSYAFDFLPSYAFTHAWIKLDTNFRERTQCAAFKNMTKATLCEQHPNCCKAPTPLFAIEYPGIFPELLGMIIGAVFLLMYLIVHDIGSNCSKCGAPKMYETDDRDYNLIGMDADVRAEGDIVKKMREKDLKTYHLVVDRLAKVYGYLPIVDYISFCAKAKECFALLGINGAGKTMTLKMLTGSESITSGDAYVSGWSVHSELTQVYRRIGYCPQNDALQEELTGRETLKVFCLIHGVPKKEISNLIDKLANAFGFTKHLDKKTTKYSGGNKRKLSAAIAFIGTPQVIYLDEPSTGMDPASQRKLWNMICLSRDSGKLVMLTTHNMGEVEALCTKAAIMSNGGIRCIGSIQHLKSKFLGGIVLKILAERSAHDPDHYEPPQRLSLHLQSRVHNIKAAVLKKYPMAVVRSVYQNLLTIFIPLIGIKWSDIFSWLENNLLKLKIEEYSISQTPLDEIFQDFAIQQEME